MAVSVWDHGPARVITIDRPDRRNAVDRPTADALEAAVRAADADDAAAVIVLTGAGGTFCAGADLHAIGTQDQNRLERSTRAPMGPTRLRTATPVIAAIEGHAVAGGLELALWADLRVAARDAVLGVLSRRFGVPLIDGGTVRLPRLVGQSRAMDLVLTGRAVGAEEAERIGLVTRLAAPGRALTDALVLAERLAVLPQRTLGADRASLLAGSDADEAALLAEHDRGVAAIEAGGMAEVVRFQSGEGRHGAPPGGIAPGDGPSG